MRFTKMQGAGNDYLYVDCVENPPPADPAALSRAMSDRHYGIGADGLILVCPSEVADARMRMFNADGSESEMCGNGVRCFAKYVYDRGLCRKNPMKVETGRGILTIELETKLGFVERATVEMGEPILEAHLIPTTLPGPQVVNYPLPQGSVEEQTHGWLRDQGCEACVTCVSMGNPHVVIQCRDVASAPLATVGPIMESSAFFPRRINVHYVEVISPDEVKMRTWERGSGITLACGTGACAVCVAGVLTGRSARRILAHLPGGDLQLHWAEADNRVYKTGPAVEVFSGDWAPRPT